LGERPICDVAHLFAVQMVENERDKFIRVVSLEKDYKHQPKQQRGDKR
jgi:hypothetical protein